MPYFLKKLFGKNTLEDDIQWLSSRVNNEHWMFLRILTLAHTREKYYFKKNVLKPHFAHYQIKLVFENNLASKKALLEEFYSKLLIANEDPF